MLRILNIVLSLLRFWPHLLVYAFDKDRDNMRYEIDRWVELNRWKRKSEFLNLLNLLVNYSEYRSLFYFRTGKKWLSLFAKGQNNLEFYADPSKIGYGLVIWHGFATVINVESMGRDCQVWHNVTLGKSSIEPIVNRPTIRDGVMITAGSIVVGNIEIGNNSVIGAGAVVVKSVPDNSKVVGQPSRLL